MTGVEKKQDQAAVSKQHLKEAAEWYAALADETLAADIKQQWQRWISASSAHGEAWARIESVAKRFDQLRDDGTGTRAPASETLHSLQERRVTRRRTLKTMLVLAGIGSATWLSLSESPYLQMADYVSAKGEIKELALSDGSKAWLNTSSHMDVHYTTEQRLIHLLSGDIFIDTAADSNRPLIVETSHGRLRALGTRFSVAEEGDHTVLAVFEGRVEVDIGQGLNRIIDTGEQISFSKETWGVLRGADPARQAWVSHVLLANDIPLVDLLSQLERYRFGYIYVEPEAAQMRVLGSFPLDEPDVALEMLAASLDISIDKPIPWWVHIRSKNK